jgi:tRNA 2-thiouridine synthesizing protein A
MSENLTIDARGLSCPQPVLLAREALKKQMTGTIEVLVDSGTARDNVARAAEHARWNVKVSDRPDGSYSVLLSK